MKKRSKRKRITKVSIDDVAKKAGCSITTVSRVINKNPAVRKSNKERVERAISELGFRPDVSARRLAGGKSETIALILPRFEDMFHTYYVTQIMRGICQTASEAGLDLLLHLTSRAKTEGHSFEGDLARISFCSGVIFADIQGNERLLDLVIKEGMPSLVMNYLDRTRPCGSITINNKDGAIKAVDYMVSLGHQRVATITGDLAIQAGRERLEGYKEALANHEIPAEDELIKVGDFSPRSAREAVLKLLKADSYPTAIFAASDEMALEAITTLRSKKIDVPQDISIVGFDDSWFSTQDPMGITTVRQPLVGMGEEAVASIKRMAFSKEKVVPRIVLPTELVVRGSCVAPLRQEDFY